MSLAASARRRNHKTNSQMRIFPELSPTREPIKLLPQRSKRHMALSNPIQLKNSPIQAQRNTEPSKRNSQPPPIKRPMHPQTLIRPIYQNKVKITIPFTREHDLSSTREPSSSRKGSQKSFTQKRMSFGFQIPNTCRPRTQSEKKFKNLSKIDITPIRKRSSYVLHDESLLNFVNDLDFCVNKLFQQVMRETDLRLAKISRLLNNTSILKGNTERLQDKLHRQQLSHLEHKYLKKPQQINSPDSASSPNEKLYRYPKSSFDSFHNDNFKAQGQILDKNSEFGYNMAVSQLQQVLDEERSRERATQLETQKQEIIEKQKETLRKQANQQVYEYVQKQIQEKQQAKKKIQQDDLQPKIEPMYNGYPNRPTDEGLVAVEAFQKKALKEALEIQMVQKKHQKDIEKAEEYRIEQLRLQNIRDIMNREVQERREQQIKAKQDLNNSWKFNSYTKQLQEVIDNVRYGKSPHHHYINQNSKASPPQYEQQREFVNDVYNDYKNNKLLHKNLHDNLKISLSPETPKKRSHRTPSYDITPQTTKHISQRYRQLSAEENLIQQQKRNLLQVIEQSYQSGRNSRVPIESRQQYSGRKSFSPMVGRQSIRKPVNSSQIIETDFHMNGKAL